MAKKCLFALVVVLFSLCLLVGCKGEIDGPAGLGERITDDADYIYSNKNMISGIKCNSRYYRIGSGDSKDINPELNIDFVEPSVLGASKYVLEYSEDSGETWSIYKYSNENQLFDFEVTTGGSISLILSRNPKSGLFRFKIVGGQYNGLYSQTITMPVFSDNPWINGSEITSPFYVNRTGSVVISYAVNCVQGGTDTDIYGTLTYQWYRTNVNDRSKRELIEGASESSYVSTEEDLGRCLIVRVTAGTPEGGLAYLEMVANPIIYPASSQNR